MTEIGTPQQARAIAISHHNGDTPAGFTEVGSGSHRTVYLDQRAGVVYKVGLDSANRQEVRTLRDLRAEGVAHAPEASLYEVTFNDWCGEQTTATVVAMPYLPDDNSVARPYPILEGAADFNAHGNVHANCGQLWLIDAGGL